MLVQCIGVFSGFIWGFGAALVVYFVLSKLLGGLRVSPQHEQRGLDYTEHAELAYPEFQDAAVFDPDQLNTRR